MNPERFEEVRKAVILEERKRDGIGVLKEKTLHSVLKRYYEPAQENHEIKIGDFVADIVGEHGIIEIQTRNMGRLVKKLEQFLKVCPVMVVYPVLSEKYLIWLDEETGETTKKRKSPKRGTIAEGIAQLYPLRQFLSNPNFTFCVVLLSGNEIRYLNGWSRDRKRGSSRCDFVPTGLLGEYRFSAAEDYLCVLPESMPETFTAKELGKAVALSGRKLYSLIHVLESLSLLEKLPKVGRAYPYRFTAREQNIEKEIGDL